MNKDSNYQNIITCPYCGSTDVEDCYDIRIRKRNIFIRFLLLPVKILNIILCLIFPSMSLKTF